MSQSNGSAPARKSASAKPKKPYPDFPLGSSTNGYWQKRIRGKLQFFGRWGKVVNGKLERLPGDGWKEALALYKAQADDLHAGRAPRQLGDAGLTVMDLCNRFLSAKQNSLNSGEITARTFAEYRATTDRLLAQFGKSRLVDDLAADDFEALRASIAKTWGPVRVGNAVQRVRTVFKYAYEAGLLDKPVRFGPQFKKPSKSVLRRHKASNGSRLFDAKEIGALLAKASPQLKAMILLGINCGFGNSDCGTLPLNAVDLKSGWIVFPRPKTGIERRSPLWPETVEALKVVIAERREPKQASDAGIVFVTKYGKGWSSDKGSDAVTLQFGKLLDELSLKQKGRAFYSLRHTFRTVADGSKDFPTVRLIMGHADQSIDAVYRETIDDQRLRAVADHVRAWLFPAPAQTEGGAK